MSDFFDIEGRLFKLITKIMNLLLLNILWTIFSISIITIGASTSALYYVTLKMAKNEEGYIIKSFIKAFVQNLKHGIIIEVIFLVCCAVLLGDIKYFIMISDSGIFGRFFVAIFAITFIIFLFVVNFAFPLLARYDDTVTITLKNAFVMSFKHLSISIAMLILLAAMLYGFFTA